MKNWRKYTIVFIFLCEAIYSYPQPVNEILKKVKAKLVQVKDYQADGVMKLNVSFLQVPDSKVTVYYKQPDKFRIRQQKGISLVPKGGISISLNSILEENKYTAVDAGSSSLNNQPVNIIKLIPLDDEDDVVLSSLYIDSRTYLVKKIITTTKENGSYTIEFQYGKFSSWALPDELVFSFNTKDYKLPKGMTFDYEEEIKRDTTKVKNTRGEVKITFNSYIINKGVKDEVFEAK
jgi:outer membrane lipoprotein-sorting protein